MRVFIAVDIPNKELYSLWKRAFQPLEGMKQKIVPPENLHITLKFLGEVPKHKVSELKTRLATIQFQKFTLKFGSMGTFPDINKVKKSKRYVLWVSAENGTQELVNLQQQVEHICETLGFPREKREFKPHLTLSRIKFPKPPTIITLKKVIENYNHQLTEGNVDVDFHVDIQAFQLKESTLTPQGAIYTTLAEFHAST